MASDGVKVRMKAIVTTAVGILAASRVTDRALVTIICSATARVVKAATRTYRDMHLETLMVDAAVMTKADASATNRVWLS